MYFWSHRFGKGWGIKTANGSVWLSGSCHVISYPLTHCCWGHNSRWISFFQPFHSERKMLRERWMLKTAFLQSPSEQDSSLSPEWIQGESASLILSEIFILVWHTPSLKAGRCGGERRGDCILKGKRLCYWKIPSLKSWHHLVANEYSSRDHFFKWWFSNFAGVSQNHSVSLSKYPTCIDFDSTGLM